MKGYKVTVQVKILTTMQRLFPPGRQERTRRETKWAEDGLLCLLTREGRAATAAWFRYRGQLSVGFGFRALRAACQI